jgi:hypothetical protein
MTPKQQELVDILRNIGGPLFAVLDATRDPARILAMLRSSGEEYQSLYEGGQGKVLEAFAPYLIRLSADSSSLGSLVTQGWGKNWGIFLVTGADFKSVRRHLRTFLMVAGPEGKRLYFRYYDPRTLRVYLPTCNAAETRFIFGPVNAYLCEDDVPDSLLVFQPGEDSPQKECVKLRGASKEMIASPVPTATPQAQDTESLKAALLSP